METVSQIPKTIEQSKSFIGNTYRFKCDCIMHLDVTGVVVDSEIIGSELILIVSSNGKVVRIGMNLPSLSIHTPV